MPFNKNPVFQNKTTFFSKSSPTAMQSQPFQEKKETNAAGCQHHFGPRASEHWKSTQQLASSVASCNHHFPKAHPEKENYINNQQTKMEKTIEDAVLMSFFAWAPRFKKKKEESRPVQSSRSSSWPSFKNNINESLRKSGLKSVRFPNGPWTTSTPTLVTSILRVTAGSGCDVLVCPLIMFDPYLWLKVIYLPSKMNAWILNMTHLYKLLVLWS